MTAPALNNSSTADAPLTKVPIMVCGRVNSSRARARRRPPTTVLRGPCVASELAGRSELVRQGGEPLPRGRTRLARCWQRRRWPACSGVPPGLSSCCECARSEPSAASSYQVVYTPLGRSRRPQRAPATDQGLRAGARKRGTWHTAPLRGAHSQLSSFACHRDARKTQFSEAHLACAR